MAMEEGGSSGSWVMVLHLAVLSLALTVLALGAMAYHTIRRLSRIQESRMRGLKGFRVGMYATLAAIQAVPVCWLLSLHGPWEGTPLGAVDAEEAACLVAWLGMLGLLTAAWRRQGALPLVPPALASMCLGFAMLAADAPTLQAAHLSGHWPIDALLRLVAHSAQMVLLLTMVMGELVMTQHVGSQLRGEPDPMLTPLKPPKPGKMGATGLPEDGRSIILAPSRWRMAASAFKYVLPKDKKQRLRLFACFVLVAMERGVNLAVPVLFKQMVDSLSQVSTLQTLGADGTLHAAAARLLSSIPGLSAPAATAASATAATAATAAATAAAASAAAAVGSTAAAAAATVSFWDLFYPSVFLYVGFYFLRGGSGAEGLLANVRDLLWIPITQAAYRNVSLDVFGHLLMLDHQFHLKRKTGQIMRVLDRGTSSIQDTVSIVLFNVLPQIADIVVACTYLALKMQPFAAGIVFVTVASYIPLTVIITERRGKIRKIMNTLDNAREGRATDMLLNYETVKFFCNEALELEGYDSSLRQYQGAEYWQMAFLAMLAIVQGTVVWLGLVSGLVVCVRGVADGSLTIGDTVLFVTMINQLYIPLTYFGSYYRQVQKALIDMENMFELINTPPSVQDPPSGAQLVTTAGEVTFDNVVFRYKEKAPAVLKGVSFHVPGGQTLAVVGATGSGKSTILRLLLRFYDVNQGSVRIDGMDVRAVTQHSLRSAIAVVPQDCMLFNDTVLHNIKYGRVGATNAEVVEAARVAHIHESIETKFKKGYLTKVGERGLRLSGGEKQRVAFARAVVKNPAILVLDEATSALDSITESQIQDSLRQMRGRCTTVIVAHRLSTIMDADIILVLDKGRVTESGSHAQLIEQGGLYQMMWSRQKSKMDQADANDITAALDAVNGGEVTDTAALSPGCSDSDDSDAPTNAHNGHGSGGKGLKGSMTPGAAETEAEADADDTEAGGVSGADVPSPTDREEESQPLLPPFLSSSPAAKPNGARTQRAGGLGRKASSGTPTAASGLASAFARAPVPPELLVPEITSSGSSLPRGSTFARPTRPRSGAGPGTAAVSAAAAAAAGGASTSAVLGAGRRSSMGLGGRLGSDPGDAGDEAGGMDAEAEEADDTITDLCGAGGSGRPSDAWDSAVASPSGFGPRTDSFDRHPSPNRMRIMSRLGVARHGAHPSDFFEDSGIDTDGSGLLHQDASGVAIAQGGTRGSGESACSDSPELGEGASLLGARLGGDIEEGGPQ